MYIETSTKNTKRRIVNIWLSALLLVVLSCSLSGCSSSGVKEEAGNDFTEPYISSENQDDDGIHTINGIEYQNNNQFYADTVTQLLTCIDEGNKEGVKTLLCNALKDYEHIDDNIDNLVDGFKGDITSVTEYGQNTVSSSSYGEDYTSAFLSDSFYVTTDEQIYSVYVAICPLDEKHDDGENIVGIYAIQIETLDYASEDIERPDYDVIEVANKGCFLQSLYGDSSNYLPVQNAANHDSIMIYRLLPNAGYGGSYEEVLAWDNRDYKSFKEAFGEPYAESIRNGKSDTNRTYCYMYKLTDSDKYAAITVFPDTDKINSLRIEDIYAYRNDEADDVILEPEKQDWN